MFHAQMSIILSGNFSFAIEGLSLPETFLMDDLSSASHNYNCAV